MNKRGSKIKMRTKMCKSLTLNQKEVKEKGMTTSTLNFTSSKVVNTSIIMNKSNAYSLFIPFNFKFHIIKKCEYIHNNE